MQGACSGCLVNVDRVRSLASSTGSHSHIDSDADDTSGGHCTCHLQDRLVRSFSVPRRCGVLKGILREGNEGETLSFNRHLFGLRVLQRCSEVSCGLGLVGS